MKIVQNWYSHTLDYNFASNILKAPSLMFSSSHFFFQVALQSLGLKSLGLKSLGLKSLGLNSPGLKSPGLKSLGLKSLSLNLLA